ETDDGRFFVCRHGRVTNVFQDEPIAADAGEDRGGCDASCLQLLAQQSAERLGTRRAWALLEVPGSGALDVHAPPGHGCRNHMKLVQVPIKSQVTRDRKSTRLNSSHVAISYAVFCLKK